MTRKCILTNKKTIKGNKVSHSNRKTKRVFLPNLHYRKIWLENEKRFVRVRLSTKALKILDLKGSDYLITYLKDNNNA